LCVWFWNRCLLLHILSALILKEAPGRGIALLAFFQTRKRKKKKKELLCSLSVCVIDVPLVLQPIEIQLGCVCRFRFMERWSLGASVVALLLLLSAASHGRGSSVRFSYACWVAVVYKLASK